MATDKQIEANRRNAKKSTGPKSPEGKAKSARNALKHGLTSRQVVLEDESAEEFLELRRNLQEDLAPGSQVEMLIVNRLAAVQWRLARVPALEAELFARLRAEPVGGDDSLGVAWERDAGPYGGALGRLVRYETALERSAGRLLAELRKLQSARLRAEQRSLTEAQARVNSRAYAVPEPPYPGRALLRTPPLPALERGPARGTGLRNEADAAPAAASGPAPGQSFAEWWDAPPPPEPPG
jgi:hypothetical protein